MNQAPQNAPSAAPQPEEKKPWPMWPFGLAILVFIVGYTWIQFEFRKEGKAREPYQDLLDRRKSIVEKNMYDWFSLSAEPSQETVPLSSEGVMLETAEGPLENFLPSQLVYYIASRPILIPELEKVEREPALKAKDRYRLKLWLPEGMGEDPRFRLSAFYKDGELHLLAQLLVPSREEAVDLFSESFAPYQFSLPMDPVEEDEIAVKLYTEGKIRSWSVKVERQPS